MVDNADIVRTLERVADLLEIRGENVYKVRAYRTAAVQVENLGEPLAEIAAREGGLLGLSGFGPAIAEKVTEVLDTGRLQFLEQLEEEVPPTLLALCELPGVGPRTASLLWTEGGISTIDELEAAARGGRLSGIPRLGAKTVERIRAALDKRRDHGAPQRRSRDRVEPLAETLASALRALPEAERVEVAGSFRRKRDTLKDLDIVVATRDRRAVLVSFGAQPEVERVLLRGDSKCSIEVDGGFQVDCRAVAPEEFGSAMQYFTGSQAHNVRLRGRALRMGMTLNEYGLFRLPAHDMRDPSKVAVERGHETVAASSPSPASAERVCGDDEADIYAALGLRWIPPEQREDHGEIDAAVLDGVDIAGAPARRKQRATV